MKIGTIIVAGGVGLRVGGEVPKQFLTIGGRMILARTVEKFVPYGDVVVVVSSEYVEFWKGECKIEHKVVSGGAQRSESVRRGLAALPDCDIILVQDGVRPFASKELIERVIDGAIKHKAVVPVVAVTDSLRNRQGVVDRGGIFAVQTPQGFSSVILRDAYSKIEDNLTDDSTVVEGAGYSITMVEGEPQNIKITTPIDLKLAEILC